MGDDRGNSNALGPNEWLVDEMYEQYLADPSSVSTSWQEFFTDYRRDQPDRAAVPAPTAHLPRRPLRRPLPFRRPPRRGSCDHETRRFGGWRRSTDARRRGTHRDQHGGEPPRPDRNELP